MSANKYSVSRDTFTIPEKQFPPLPDAIIIYIAVQYHQPVSVGQLFFDLSNYYDVYTLHESYDFLLRSGYLRESRSKKGFRYVANTKKGKDALVYDDNSEEPEQEPPQEQEPEQMKYTVPEDDDLDKIADANTEEQPLPYQPYKISETKYQSALTYSGKEIDLDMSTGTCRYKSQSSGKEKFYTTSLTECTCRDYHFNKDTAGYMCKHMVALCNTLGLLQKV